MRKSSLLLGPVFTVLAWILLSCFAIFATQVVAAQDNDNLPPLAPVIVWSSLHLPAFEYPLPVITTEETIYLEGTAEANATINVEVSTDNGETWTEDTAAATTVDSDGNWSTTVTPTEGVMTRIRLRAKDSAGNESSATMFTYVVVDLYSPIVTITSPADGTITDQKNVMVTGTVIKDIWEDWDELTLTIQVGGDNVIVPISDGSFSHIVALEKGTNTITVSVIDGRNMPNTSSFTVTRVVTPWGIYTIIFGIVIALLLGIIYSVIKKRRG